jgi:hypothetical protein
VGPHPVTADERVRAALGAGRLLDLRTGDADDPAHGHTWDAERTVRAGLLAELLTRPADGPTRPVHVRGARVTGRLDLEYAALTRPLTLRDCHFDEPVELTEAAAPAIRLPGCHLPGLVGRQLRTTGDLVLDHAVTGELDLASAHIGGRLALNAAHVRGGVAVNGEGLTVVRAVECREGFRAEGEIRLTGATLGALEFSGATLSNPASYAIAGMGITVEQNLFFRHGSRAEGEVRLIDARVGGRMIFSGDGVLSNSGGLALDLELARAGVLLLFIRTVGGGVDLTNAHADAFGDDRAAWPIMLRGFTFDSFEKDAVEVRERLKLLAGQPEGYLPQPYDQLAGVYRRIGREDCVRRVAIAKQWHRRTVQSPISRVANWLLYLTVGYGYRTWLAAVWLAGLLALGTWGFASAYPHHLTKVAANAPAFSAVGYTLDVLLPIVDLGQQKAWAPQGAAMYFSWVLIAAGWVLTTAVVAGLTGVIKRD